MNMFLFVYLLVAGRDLQIGVISFLDRSLTVTSRAQNGRAGLNINGHNQK